MDQNSLRLAMVTGDLQAIAYRLGKLNEATKETTVVFQNFAGAQQSVQANSPYKCKRCGSVDPNEHFDYCPSA